MKIEKPFIRREEIYSIKHFQAPNCEQSQLFQLEAEVIRLSRRQEIADWAVSSYVPSTK